ncbi:MAG: flotillin family protein, partial [Ruminiclostridium sp.]|nr:flotillin family protein [Ruminiclostridium sp.]
IDKVTVWDGGSNGGKNGKTATSDFISGLFKSVPPLNEMFDQAGMKLPDYLGKDKADIITEVPEAPQDPIAE